MPCRTHPVAMSGRTTVEGAVETEQAEPALAWHGLYPVRLVPVGCLRAEVEVDRSIGVSSSRLSSCSERDGAGLSEADGPDLRGSAAGGQRRKRIVGEVGR